MCPCCHGVLGHEEVWFDPKVGPPERAILTDLIAGVQTAIDDYEPRMHGSARAYLLGIRDRAEARLQEVQGD